MKLSHALMYVERLGKVKKHIAIGEWDVVNLRVAREPNTRKCMSS